MTIRVRVLPLLVLLFASLALAGGKKKVLLPAYVLQARTVCVLLDPTAGTSMTAPLANKTAQEDNERPVVIQPRDHGGRVGIQQGRPPGATQSGPQDTKPHPQMEAGPPDDMFVVYEGHIDGPEGRAPVWQYEKKDALKLPGVPAVAEFRKLIDEAEKQ